MTTLYVLIGLPASGKSSWARENVGRLRAVAVGSDDVRRDFQANGRDTLNTDLVFAEVERRAHSLLQAGQSVILDATHYNRQYRLYALQLAIEIDVRRVAVWFDLPLSICLERNARRGEHNFDDEDGPFFLPTEELMRSIADQFQPPGLDEFDEVVRVGRRSSRGSPAASAAPTPVVPAW